MKVRAAAASLAMASVASAALDVDLDSADSIKAAAKLVAADLISYYKGNQPGQTPGILPGPPPAGDYYWWEGGAMWGTFLDYWHYTGDNTYNDLIEQALIWQAGAPQNSFMPLNWTASLGNDDQGFWGMSAMLAAELNFQNPPKDQPQWLALAQAVFNTQAAPDRHDMTCNGGLRWQIPWANIGYNYKNTIANAIFFNLGARLARYTRNDTYAQIATTTWDWIQGVGYVDQDYNVFDGGHVEANCTDIFKAQFSYNAASLLQGVAFMYSYTNGSEPWNTHVHGLLKRTIEVFFSNGPALEVSCELEDRISCNTDMLSFKGYLHRWMASTAQLVPDTKDMIMAVLKNSTAAAVKACSGGANGRQCGFRWTTGTYDGLTGAGQEMNVLAALSSLLLTKATVAGPVTNSTGGTSIGDPNAGINPPLDLLGPPPETRDRAGAGILTVLAVAFLVTTMAFMTTNYLEKEGKGERMLSEKQPAERVAWS